MVLEKIGKTAISTCYVLIFLFASHSYAGYRTLEGEIPFSKGKLEFQVHGESYHLPLMGEIKRMLEEDKSFKEMLNYFEFNTRTPVHFFMNERSRIANGFASPFPHNFIMLYDFPPLDQNTLSVSPGWMKVLVLHELVHILHIDQSRGFFHYLRNVFGSISKPQAIAPRWFIEGIAVWAESEFTDYGRLKSHTIRFEFYQKMKASFEDKFCNQIGCLDNPKYYPFQGFAYWAGSYFMEYLEGRKKGAVRCLIEENGNALPFFLNGAFIDCFGENAEQLFYEFRKKFVEDYEAQIKREYAETKLYDYQNSYLNGSETYNGKYYFVAYKQFEQFLVEYDPKSNSYAEFELMDRIENIFVDEEGLKIKAYIGIDERGYWRVFKFENEKFIALRDTPAPYDFVVEGKRRVQFFYGEKDYRWLLKDNDQTVMHFSAGNWVHRPNVSNDYLVFQTSKKEDSLFSLNRYDFKTKSLNEVYQTKADELKYFGRCGEDIIYLALDKTKNLIRIGKKNVIYNLSGRYFDLIDGRISNDFSVLVFKGGAEEVNKSCNSFFKQFSSQKLSFRKPNSGLDTELPTPESSSFYPAFKHMLPQYWYAFYSSGGNLNYGLLRTKLVDPRGYHNVDLGVNFYSEESLTGPQVGYTYSTRYFFSGVRYEKDYSKSSFYSVIDEDEVTQLFMGRQFLGDQIAYVPQFSVSLINENDFIGSREQHVYQLFQQFLFLKQRQFQFFDGLNFSLLVANYDLQDETLADFWSLRTSSQFAFNFSRIWKLNFKLAYSRLFKDDFANGVVFGGGVSGDATENNSSFHDFRGIAYKDIYGNTISTVNVDNYIMLGAPFKQSGFIPFQLKEIGFLAGLDYASAERIIVNNILKRDSEAQSAYYGLRGKARILYSSDVNIDMIFASVTSGDDSQSQFLFNITAEI